MHVSSIGSRKTSQPVRFPTSIHACRTSARYCASPPQEPYSFSICTISTGPPLATINGLIRADEPLAVRKAKPKLWPPGPRLAAKAGCPEAAAAASGVRAVARQETTPVRPLLGGESWSLATVTLVPTLLFVYAYFCLQLLKMKRETAARHSIWDRLGPADGGEGGRPGPGPGTQHPMY